MTSAEALAEVPNEKVHVLQIATIILLSEYKAAANQSCSAVVNYNQAAVR